MMEFIFVLIAFALFLYALVYGGIKAFQRNGLVFILLLIFLPGILMIWILIECFTGPVDPKGIYDLE